MTALLDRVCGIGDEAASGLTEQVRTHTELGFHGIELRTVGGSGIHRLSLDEVRAIADDVAAAGLVIPVLDTPVGSWAVSVRTDLESELDVLRASLDRAALLGCTRLRVMSYQNDGLSEHDWRAESLRRMRVLADVAEQAGMVLLHENCHGWAGQGSRQSLDMMATVDSPALRLLFDTGNGLAYGYDGPEFLRAVIDLVDHVHVKDGHHDANGEAVFGMPGEGEADIAGCVTTLEEHGYAGWYSIEPHVALIPHLGVSGDPALMRQAYAEYGRRFFGLLDSVVSS